MLVSVSILIWRIKAGNRGWKYAGSRVITTIIVLFFLVHPTVTRHVFAVFHCRAIDGESRLVSDLGVVCYAGSHLAWAIAGGGLGLTLWVAGIPWAAFAVLRDKRRQLSNAEVR